MSFTLLSFNCNSVRKRIESGQFANIADTLDPLVMGLQETKVEDQHFPHQAFARLGYPHCYVFGQKTHYGVALISKVPLHNVAYGFPGDKPDEQRRLISADLIVAGTGIRIINGYFPQGESRHHQVKFPYKERFFQKLDDYLHQQHSPQQPLMVMGDINISPEDIDIGIGENNRKRWLQTGKCSFLPEERAMMQRLLDYGLSDCYRHLYPHDCNTFSWFDYRSRGFESEPKRGLRIDLQLTTRILTDTLINSGVDYAIRAMDTPSDHAPVWASFQD